MTKYEFRVDGKKFKSIEGRGDVVQILFALNKIANELAENNRILRRMHYRKTKESMEDEA